MKSQIGGRFQIEIDVMNRMKTPQKRNFVRQNVPYVERVIQQRDD